MAKIYLIYLDIDTGYFPGLHHGLASLAAIIRQKGHVLKFHHLFKEEPPDELANKVLEFNPDIVGFSITTNQKKYLERYSKAISNKTKVLQIAGGVHATISPTDLFIVDSIQGVCIGEAEYTLTNLLGKIDEGKSFWEVNGFWWRTSGGTIKQNPVPALNTELSKLPYPDYSIFDVNKINEASSGWMAMMVTRGCPHSCSYCCNYTIRSVYPNKEDYVRLPPVDYAISLIKNNLSYYPGTKGINFADDLLVLNKAWFKDFADKYSVDIGLPFICNARAEYLTEEICSVLKRSGCIIVQMGIESGNEWLRKYLLNRKASNNQIIEAFKLLKRFGIQRFSFNILGFPFETKELMEETLSFNKLIRPEMGSVFYFFPYPGTRLHSICKEFGLLTKSSEELSGYLEYPAINLTHCRVNDCKKIYVKLKLYLLSRMVTKNLRFGAILISTAIYYLFNIKPYFFVDLFTRKSGLKFLLRKIAYKRLFIERRKRTKIESYATTPLKKG